MPLLKPMIVGAICCLSLSAHAEFWNGNELLDKLKSESLIQRSFGLGYVAGVSDTTYKYMHCMPQYVSVKQVGDVVILALEASPEDRRKNADALVVRALSTAWPCKKPAGKESKPL